MGKASDRDVEKILKEFRIPVPKHFLVSSEEQAVGFAKRIGYPLVLKVSSPQIMHKTEIGGVITGIGCEKELRKAYNKLLENVRKKAPRARIGGMIVQEMIEGHELIVGSKIDPQFGPVIMFGMGGIFVEVLEDVSFRLIPVNRKDVREMIGEIRGYAILKGARGKRGINFKALEDCLLKVSGMVWKKYRSRKPIKELDINPLFANKKGVFAADVRVIY